jgi:predicted PurR-regulated permease PerM
MILRLFKLLILAFFLTLFIYFVFALTQSFLYWPTINWVLKKKGVDHIIGDERGTEVAKVVYGLILPVLFCISLVVIWWVQRWKKNDSRARRCFDGQ